MDGNDEPDQQWPGTSQSYVSTSRNGNNASSTFRTSPQNFNQDPLQGFAASLGDNQFQPLGQGGFQNLYQVPNSSFERNSPDFDTGAHSSANDNLHQLQNIRVGSHLLSNYSLPYILGVSSSSSSVSSSSATQQPIIVDAASCSTSASTSQSRQQSDSASAQPSSSQVYQVVLDGHYPGESSSEATPVVVRGSNDNEAASLQRYGRPSRDIQESYVNEPDTTQDEDGLSQFQQIHAQVHNLESNEAFAAESSHNMSVDNDPPGTPQIDSTGLDSSVVNDSMNTPAMNNSLDSEDDEIDSNMHSTVKLDQHMRNIDRINDSRINSSRSSISSHLRNIDNNVADRRINSSHNSIDMNSQVRSIDSNINDRRINSSHNSIDVSSHLRDIDSNIHDRSINSSHGSIDTHSSSINDATSSGHEAMSAQSTVTPGPTHSQLLSAIESAMSSGISTSINGHAELIQHSYLPRSISNHMDSTVDSVGIDSSNSIDDGQVPGPSHLDPGPSHIGRLHCDIGQSNAATSKANRQSELTSMLTAQQPMIDSSGLKAEAGQVKEHTVEVQVTSVRKSQRIASILRPPSPRDRPKYNPNNEYDAQNLWCDECQFAYPGECTVHKLVPVADKMVLTRARASLPAFLQIQQEMEDKDYDNFPWGWINVRQRIGVFAKKQIPKRYQFGPFLAKMVDSRENIPEGKISFELEREGSSVYLDTSDENESNWMMFVQPAKCYSEQNMVAYQYGEDIYFSTTKIIDPKLELKVWYASHYAHRLGITTHEMNEQDIKAVKDESLRFECYECNERFQTSSQLDAHVLVHDPESAHESRKEALAEATDPTVKGKGIGKSSARKRSNNKKVKELVPPVEENNTEKPTEEEDSNKFQSWKKKKTNMYLNRMKKYQNTTVKKAVRSLTKRRITQIHPCHKCNIFFDNPELFAIHQLTHQPPKQDNQAAISTQNIGNGSNSQIVEPIENMNGVVQPDKLVVERYQINPHSQQLEKIVEMPQQNTIQFQPTDTGEAGNIHQQPLAPPPVPSGVMEVTIATDSDNIFMKSHTCPVCNKSFPSRQEWIDHVREHAYNKQTRTSLRPYKCSDCWKSFATTHKLKQHMLCHGSDENKPFQCKVCLKRFMNNCALGCHMKTHSDKSYYQCPICREGFDQIHVLNFHTQTHCENGVYSCLECHRQFTDYPSIKKHMRTQHAEMKYACEVCGKQFSRPDKKRLHMVKHSNVAEFMCENCGRQFKRKDKLKEHKQRMHNPERESRRRITIQSDKSKKFTPVVSPSDYHRFIYKCHTCMLGFKRRGMLVNHLAKRHPNVKPESVPELNLPILRTQKDYFCQYCDKVYKSSSKRKSHILKNHPGLALPPSSRVQQYNPEVQEAPTEELDLTYSQTIGSITTVPHQCDYCHKQYASKAKLVQHQRTKHRNLVPPMMKKPKAPKPLSDTELKTQILTAHIVQPQDPKFTHDGGKYEESKYDENLQNQEVIQADLLTQAMNELNQTFNATEYRIQDFQGAAGNEVQVTSDGALQQLSGATTHTIDLSQLSALGHFQVISGQAGDNIQGPIAIITTPGTSQGNDSTQSITLPVNVGSGTATFVAQGWTPSQTVSQKNM